MLEFAGSSVCAVIEGALTVTTCTHIIGAVTDSFEAAATGYPPSYRDNDRATAFAIETKAETRLLVPAIEGRKITVSVDDKVLGSTSAGASASFKVPAGVHKVLIVK